jgi:hypothetical protein
MKQARLNPQPEMQQQCKPLSQHCMKALQKGNKNKTASQQPSQNSQTWQRKTAEIHEVYCEVPTSPSFQTSTKVCACTVFCCCLPLLSVFLKYLLR